MRHGFYMSPRACDSPWWVTRHSGRTWRLPSPQLFPPGRELSLTRPPAPLSSPVSHLELISSSLRHVLSSSEAPQTPSSPRFSAHPGPPKSVCLLPCLPSRQRQPGYIGAHGQWGTARENGSGLDCTALVSGRCAHFWLTSVFLLHKHLHHTGRLLIGCLSGQDAGYGMFTGPSLQHSCEERRQYSHVRGPLQWHGLIFAAKPCRVCCVTRCVEL